METVRRTDTAMKNSQQTVSGEGFRGSAVFVTRAVIRKLVSKRKLQQEGEALQDQGNARKERLMDARATEKQKEVRK